jgi:lipopolysaccharide cholinephosphotransferase
MKEMTLQEVQKVSLNILKDVHSFCESHNIRYSLAYGTLIGAIRHKGFIPWDDDVDILIPRPDFERFCDEYKSSCGYKLYSPQDPLNYMVFARVCDNDHTIVRTNHPWSSEQTGIWIDVFPLDGLPDGEKEFQALVKSIRRVAKKVYRLRFGKYLKLSETSGCKDFFFCLVKKLLYIWYDIRVLNKKHIFLMTGYNYDEAQYCGQLCVMDYPEKEHNPKEDFENYIKVSFADSEFYVMNGYDNILKRYYGNYMELPPAEKRVLPQSFTQKYYWKE